MTEISLPANIACAWPDSLLNGSEMGRRIRDYDWSSTTLGAIETWPQSLRDHVGMLVDNTFAMYIFWGPENIAIYNDAYVPIAADKHPRMLAMPTREIWGEVWQDIAPLIDRAKRGHAVTLTDLRLLLERRGFAEEAYFTFSYAPLRENSGRIAGVLATVHETTSKMLMHRRLETLRELAFRSAAALTETESLAHIAGALEGSEDLPFALIYLANEGSNRAVLAARVGRPQHEVPSFDVASLGDPDWMAGVNDRFGDSHRVAIEAIAAPDRRRNIGALIAGTSPQLRLDDDYRQFISMVASQIANSIAAARAFGEERARAESLHVTRTIEKIGLFAESGQQLFWMTKPDGSVDWLNQAWYDYSGQPPDEAKGWGWQAIHHPDDLPEVMCRWAESLEKRTPFEMTFRLRGKDARYRWFLTRAVPEFDDEQNVVRWYGTSTNIDSERRVAQQYDFLASLSERLVRRPDRLAMLDAFVQGVVRELADWTLVNLVDEHGTLLIAAARHRNPENTMLLQKLIGKPYGNANAMAHGVIDSGRARLLESTSADLVRAGLTPEFAALAAQLGLRSVIIVPIAANGRLYGTFHAVLTEEGRAYGPGDVPFFEEIGRRIGIALQNADAYERERRIAHAFQSAALPRTLPRVPGLRFSSHYEPASNEANVGGDFYDAFRLVDGRVVVSIGDVAGSGLGAAATMAALRQSIRAVASVNPDPDMLLKAADGVFADSGRPPFASAFVAVLDPLTFSLQYASAGHPAPVLRNPDASVTQFEGTDVLLGIGSSIAESSRRVGKATVQPGSLLVLYTDGLTEARRDPIDGEARLREAVRAGAGDARAIWQAVVGPGLAAHDDVAVIAVHLDAPLLALQSADVLHWHFVSKDGEEARRVRGAMVRELQASGIAGEDIFAAEIVFAELVGNVVRHAGDTLDVVLDLTQQAPVLHVIDTGEGFSLNPKLPADAFAERGRGLFIVAQLAREFSVSPRTSSSGSHARAVLYGRVTRAVRAGVPG